LTSLQSLANVTYVGELVSTDQENRLQSLQSENLRLKKLNWNTVDLDQAMSTLDKGNCGRSFLHGRRNKYRSQFPHSVKLALAQEAHRRSK
jgi:hypothetical protein